jgi:hypothetical protein
MESGLNQKVLLDDVERVELVGEGEDEVRRRPMIGFYKAICDSYLSYRKSYIFSEY